MRMDPGYELEEMETNMESLFDHVNSMSNTDMPCDYLASISKHFFRDVGEKFSTFQNPEVPNRSVSGPGAEKTSLGQKEGHISKSISFNVLSFGEGCC